MAIVFLLILFQIAISMMILHPEALTDSVSLVFEYDRYIFGFHFIVAVTKLIDPSILYYFFLLSHPQRTRLLRRPLWGLLRRIFRRHCLRALFRQRAAVCFILD